MSRRRRDRKGRFTRDGTRRRRSNSRGDEVMARRRSYRSRARRGVARAGRGILPYIIPAAVQGAMSYAMPSVNPAIGEGAAGVIDYVAGERAGGKALLSGAVGEFVGAWARGGSGSTGLNMVA